MQRTNCLLLVALTIAVAISFAQAKGIAFAFSGAGARFGQHLALMEALIFGLTPSKEIVRPDFISAVSAGSFDAVGLSAVLQTLDGKNKTAGFTIDDFKNYVLNLKTSNLYDDSKWGKAKIFAHNLPNGYILDNSVMKTSMQPLTERMGYKYFGDLYIPTCITVVNQTSGENIRMWSTDPRYKNIELLDIIAGTAAMPVAFAPVELLGTKVVDGGSGEDVLPVVPLLNNPLVTKMYLLSYNSILFPNYNSEFSDHLLILHNMLAAFSNMGRDFYISAVQMASVSKIQSYLYIPDLPQTFGVLDVENLKKEYNLSIAWAQQNNPTPLNNINLDIV